MQTQNDTRTIKIPFNVSTQDNLKNSILRKTETIQLHRENFSYVVRTNLNLT